ncbi:MAG: ATP-dependent 6-phosphofructokinase [Sandaracinus sp.]
MRVGILTGGGDCPGLNAVIRAAVTIGIERHGFEVFGIEDAFSGLIDLDYRSPDGNRWLSVRDVRNVLERGGTLLGTSNRCDPFRYPTVDAQGKTVLVDVTKKVLENFELVGLDALISVGGDGSMHIARKLSDLGLPIVGVPKTIDNDLGATDQTFGFDTAVHTAMEAIDRVRDTAASHDRVMFVEVMGRDAGWIALHAGLAGGADAILIPEIPYRIEPLAEMVARRKREGLVYSIVVIAEGAIPAEGEASALAARPGEMRRLVGAGPRAADALAERIHADVRVTVLGHVQRGGSPTPVDRVLGTRYGHAAADLVAAKQFGRMVSLRDGQIVSVPLAEATAKPKRVDPNGQLVQTARAMGITFGD